MEEKIKIFNREISLSDIELIRGLIEKEASKGRTYISKELCRIWQWKNPTGQYRDIACRILLRRLEQKRENKTTGTAEKRQAEWI